MKKFQQGAMEGRPLPIISLMLSAGIGFAAISGCSANQPEGSVVEKITADSPIGRNDISVHFQSIEINGQSTRAAMALADGYQNISFACVTMGTAEGLIAVPGTTDEINTLDGNFDFDPSVSTCSDGSIELADRSVIKEEYLRTVATYSESGNS